MPALRVLTSCIVRALIYARVSSDPRGRGRSVDEQIAECKEWAGRESWDVVDIVRDDNRSASRHAKRKRTGWADVHRRLGDGGVDLVVTWEASRAQRDLTAYTELRDLCSRHGVRWAYSGTVYDLTDRSDRFRTGLDALVAEDEAERTRERVLRAMRANAAKGRPHGRLPFGYRRIYDPATRELVRQEPDPVQAPLVEEAARRFLAGESARSIASDWNQRNISTPHGDGRWDLTQIRRILTNPAMNAKRVHQGAIVGDGTWAAILDDETFARLQARFADPSRRVMRRTPTARLLTGVLRCGVCGGAMQYQRLGGFGDRKLRHSYGCRQNQCVGRDMHALDAYVTGVTLEHLRNTDAAALLDGGEGEGGHEALAEVRDLTAQIDAATQEFIAKRISATTLGTIETELRSRIAEAQRRIRYDALPTIAAELAGADDIDAEWDAYSVEQRRELIKSLFEVVVLPVKTRGRKAFDPTRIRIDPRR